ncbi:hypothetical protein MKEN_00922000 [Mycena kentingensis (nom. inval.)]|nr:hypothetical protein MKEN_00922000 [Mycena kentingensis (nom. inval.)]
MSATTEKPLLLPKLAPHLFPQQPRRIIVHTKHAQSASATVGIPVETLLVQIIEALADVKANQETMARDLAKLTSEVADLKADQQTMSGNLAKLTSEVADLKARQENKKGFFGALRRRLRRKKGEEE